MACVIVAELALGTVLTLVVVAVVSSIVSIVRARESGGSTEEPAPALVLGAAAGFVLADGRPPA